jgi:predicted anti-sigma-YlaC factor YlaD
MTTDFQPPRCDEVRMAAQARLDGEPAHLTPAEVDAHTASCGACQAALAGFTAMHGALDRVDYERLNVDLWPAVFERLAADSLHRTAEIWALLGLTAALVAWRLAQLLLEWPAPVVNSIVPLVLIVLVLRRITGDPFAIRSASHLRQQEGVS